MITALAIAVLVLAVAQAIVVARLIRLERWIIDCGLTLAALRPSHTSTTERPHQ